MTRTLGIGTGRRWHGWVAAAGILAALAGTAGVPAAEPTVAAAATVDRPLVIYGDALGAGWREWSSRQADVRLALASPVYSGARGMSFTIMSAGARLYLHADTPVDLTPYTALHFAAMASQPGQRYAVQLLDANERPLGTAVPLASVGGDPVTGTWTAYTIPLPVLAAAGQRTAGVTIIGLLGTAQPAVYLDDIDLRTPAMSAARPTLTPAGATATATATATRPPATPTGTATSAPTRTPTTPAAATPTRTPTASAPSPTVTAAPAGTWRRPPTGKSWQWQIDGQALDLGPAQRGETLVYDVDYEYYSAATVAQLKALGQYAVAYMDIGAWESYRPDAGDFAPAIVGANTGWNGEAYLDIRPASLDLPGPTGKTLRDIIRARLDVARAKGFDAVEGDYQNNLGDCGGCFGITLADQEAFNQFFIAETHARGMAAVLKNAPEWASRWAAWPDAAHPHGYDAALNEECNRFRECGGYDAFVQTGRPVWNAEYTDYWPAAVLPPSFCAADNQHGFNGLLKKKPLDAWRAACR